MKWIRWQGLIAFVVISAALAAFWLLFVDRMVERYIEKAGTDIVGAKVELDKADLTLFPLGLTLTGLHVTDPGEPMRNAVEAGRIAFLMDAVNLVMRKVIIDEMAITGVRLNTPRTYSGAIEKKAGRERSSPALVTFSIPSVDEVLEGEDLESLRLAKEVEESVKADRERFAAALKAVPDERRIKEYRDRFERLKAKTTGPAGMIEKASEFSSLKKDIEKDIEAAKALANDAGKTVGYYRDRLGAAVGAPARDVKRLAGKYALTRQGLTNLSRVFFGGELFAWADKALMWRGRAERAASVYKAYKGDGEVEVRPRGSGADVLFPDKDPLPSFLVRKATVSVNVPSGDISGEVLDITGEQRITGRPIRFRFAGERLKGLDSMSLIGEINRVAPESPRDYARFDVRGYGIKDLVLSGGEAMPLDLRKGSADISVSANIAGAKLDAGLKASLSGLDLAAGRPGEANPFLKAASEALSGVKGFRLEAKASGTVEDYDIAVSSDLDKVLGESAGRVIAARVAAFETELTERVREKVAGPLEKARAELSAIAGIQEELGLRKGLMDGLADEIKKELTKGAPVKGIKIPGLPF